MAVSTSASKKRKRRRRRNRAKVYLARFIALLVLFAVIFAIIFGGRLIFEKAGELLSAREESADESTIKVSSKGVITGSIVEDFDESVYDADELESMVNQEISDYDALAGSDKAVSLESFEVKDGKAVVAIKYDTCEDYRSFNNTLLYAGKVAEVAKSGVTFDKALKSTDDEDGIAAGNTSKIEDLKAVVLDENVAVSVPGRIKYYSDGVEITGKKSAKVTDDNEGNAFIIYK